LFGLSHVSGPHATGRFWPNSEAWESLLLAAVPVPDQHDLVLEPKKTGAGGGSLLRFAAGVEDLAHPSLLPYIG